MIPRNRLLPAITGHQIRLLLLRLKTPPPVASRPTQQFAADLERLKKAHENASLSTASFEARWELLFAFRNLETNLNWFEVVPAQREREDEAELRFYQDRINRETQEEETSKVNPLLWYARKVEFNFQKVVDHSAHFNRHIDNLEAQAQDVNGNDILLEKLDKHEKYFYLSALRRFPRLERGKYGPASLSAVFEYARKHARRASAKQMIATAGENTIDSVISNLANDKEIYGAFKRSATYAPRRPSKSRIHTTAISKTGNDTAKLANDQETHGAFKRLDSSARRKPRKSRIRTTAISTTGNDTAKLVNDQKIYSPFKRPDFYAPGKPLKFRIRTTTDSAIRNDTVKPANDMEIFGACKHLDLYGSSKTLKLHYAAKLANDQKRYDHQKTYGGVKLLKFPIRTTANSAIGSSKPLNLRYAPNSAIGNDTAKLAKYQKTYGALKRLIFFAPRKPRKLRYAAKLANDQKRYDDQKTYGGVKLLKFPIRTTANSAIGSSKPLDFRYPSNSAIGNNTAKLANDQKRYDDQKTYGGVKLLKFPIRTTANPAIGSSKPLNLRYPPNSAIGNDTAKLANDQEIYSPFKRLDFCAPRKTRKSRIRTTANSAIGNDAAKKRRKRFGRHPLSESKRLKFRDLIDASDFPRFDDPILELLRARNDFWQPRPKRSDPG